MSTTSTAQCPLCLNSAKSTSWFDKVRGEGVHTIECEFCGTFRVTEHAAMLLESFERKHLLAGAMREATDLAPKRIPFSIDSEVLASRTLTHLNLEQIADRCPTGVTEKIDKLLLSLERRSKYPGEALKFEGRMLPALAYAQEAEISFYLRHAQESELATWNRTLGDPISHIVLQLEGWKRVEELQRARSTGEQAFVAMWFNPEVQAAYELGIAPGIEAAGYRPCRVDREEFNDGVFDKVITGIRQSKFVVTDLTGRRPNAYLEAGYALGLGLELILTCRSDYLDGSHPDKRVDFDLQHRNLIVWDDERQLKERLEARILATLGRGPLQKVVMT